MLRQVRAAIRAGIVTEPVSADVEVLEEIRRLRGGR